jgi:hypothetical protein
VRDVGLGAEDICSNRRTYAPIIIGAFQKVPVEGYAADAIGKRGFEWRSAKAHVCSIDIPRGVHRAAGLRWFEGSGRTNPGKLVCADMFIEPVKRLDIIEAQVAIVALQAKIEIELTLIADASGGMSRAFCSGERGKQQAGENGDDGNDNEQLDQSKSEGGFQFRLHGELKAASKQRPAA